MKAQQALGTSLVAAIGVVFGDIGTSPLYAFKESLAAAGFQPGTEAAIFGQGPVGRPAAEQHLAARKRQVRHIRARKPTWSQGLRQRSGVRASATRNPCQ